MQVRFGGQEHFYLETQVSRAVPKGEDGEMEIFSSCQSPTIAQACRPMILDYFAAFEKGAK